MRDKETQSILDKMTILEKRNRTRLRAMQERGIVIKRYEYRVLCKNEFPHKDRGENQMVLRMINGGYKRQPYKEFGKICVEWKGKRMLRHADKEKSVLFREHRHIFEPPNVIDIC